MSPNKPPALAGAFFPGLASLRNRSTTVEPDFHTVEPIRNEILRRVMRFTDHLLLVVQTSLGIDSDEIVTKDMFNCRGDACGDRLCPLPFALQDVAFYFLLVFLCAAIAKTKRSENSRGSGSTCVRANDS